MKDGGYGGRDNVYEYMSERWEGWWLRMKDGGYGGRDNVYEYMSERWEGWWLRMKDGGYGGRDIGYVRGGGCRRGKGKGTFM